MTALVVDTSAVLRALLGVLPAEDLNDRLSGSELHAPHLIDVEMLHSLRRLVSTGRIDEGRAQDARGDFADLTIARYPHHPLADRIWDLRHNFTAYDAAFVSLSEALGAPLVTCDGRLAAAPGHSAQVELFSG